MFKLIYCQMILLLILLETRGSAADKDLTVNIDETLAEMSLHPYLEFFEDQDHRLDIEQLLQSNIKPNFSRPDKKVLTFGYSTSTWWARIQLNNPTGKNLPFYILQRYPLLDTIEFYATADGKVLQRFRSGDSGHREESVPVYRSPLFHVDLPPGSTTVYFKVNSKGPINFDVIAYSEQQFHVHHLQEYVIVYALLSIILVMALYNFFIFLQLRKPAFLIYVLFLISMLMQPLGYSGLFTELLPNLPYLTNEGYLIIGEISAFLCCLYAIYFLSLRGRHPWLLRICYAGIAYAVLATAAALFIPYAAASKMAALGAIVAAVAMLICGVTCSLKRFRPAYFFTLAWSFLIFATVIRSFTLMGILPLSFFTEWAALIGTVIEVILLSLGLSDKQRLTENRAFARIETLNAHLQQKHAEVLALNENLERRVDEQTREVKSILQHIQTGIVVAKGEKLTITPIFSDFTRTLFRTEQVEGRDLVDFIFQSSALNSEHRSKVRSILNSCMNEDAINAQINLHALPRELERIDGNEQQRLQLDWNPVVNASGIVEKMLVTIKDITELKKLELVAAEKSKELAYIGEILEVQVPVFERFVDSSQKFLAENERLIKANMKYSPDILKVLFINMHTIKGVARSLGFQHLTPFIHDAEQKLAAMMKRELRWDQQELMQDLLFIKGRLEAYQFLSQNKLGRQGGASLAVTQEYAESLNRFFTMVDASGYPELRQASRPLRKVVEDLILAPAGHIFAEVLSTADMLARDLKKEFPKIEIVDKGIFLTRKGQDLIRHTFIHILRNTMDHGIESPAQRTARGKSPEGHIRVAAELTEDGLKVTYADDGQGLNLTAIRKIAIAKGLLSETDQTSPLETSYLIFESGFSTSDEVNEISGRGVGMSAVKEYMDSADGHLQIKLLNRSRLNDCDFQEFMFEFELRSDCYVKKVA